VVLKVAELPAQKLDGPVMIGAVNIAPSLIVTQHTAVHPNSSETVTQ
jgi:hypothetical protein